MAKSVLEQLDIVFTRDEWAAMCAKHGSKMPYPYADVIPITRGRLAAAGKIGDDDAPQAQRPEVD